MRDDHELVAIEGTKGRPVAANARLTAWHADVQELDVMRVGPIEHARRAMVEGRGAGKVAAAKALVAALGDLQPLWDLRERLAAIRDFRPSMAMAMTHLSLTLQGFPNSKMADPAITIELWASDLVAEGFGPHVIARGCAIVRRKCKFPPVLADFVEACTAASEELRQAIYWIDWRRELVAQARAAIDSAARQPELLAAPAEAAMVPIGDLSALIARLKGQGSGKVLDEVPHAAA